MVKQCFQTGHFFHRTKVGEKCQNSKMKMQTIQGFFDHFWQLFFIGMEGNCINEKLLCNCDSKTPTWLNDTGLITNKNLLPITSFNYGPLKYDIEEANVQIGKLKCSGLADSLFGFMHPQLAIGNVQL